MTVCTHYLGIQTVIFRFVSYRVLINSDFLFNTAKHPASFQLPSKDTSTIPLYFGKKSYILGTTIVQYIMRIEPF
jgi:hypothetical protein